VWSHSLRENDPSKIKEARRAIQEGVRRIEELAASTAPFLTVAAKFTAEIVYCLAADAGGFWFVEDNCFRPAVLINEEVAANCAPGFENFRRSAMERTRAENLTLLFPPVSERDHFIQPLNPSRYILLYSRVPWRCHENPVSIIEVMIRRPSPSPRVRSGYKAFLNEMVAKIGSGYSPKK
jgi:hypothetical protein